MKVIILAGGAGTRLWPLSRTNYPKQFIRLRGMEQSIFQMTVSRCLGFAAMEDIIIVTNAEYKMHTALQIEEMGQTPVLDNILPEPMPRNTLPAIYNGVKHIRKTGDDVVGVFPSDHLIIDDKAFCATVQAGVPLTSGHIVTFGIPPTSPETGYGYIQPGADLPQGGRQVAAFREKPELDVAKQYVKDGYLWNSGMFMFRTDLFDAEVQQHCPGVYEAFQSDDTEECFRNTPAISIDYGVMEKTDKVAVIPLQSDWNDLGGFAAIYDTYCDQMDENGNVPSQNSILVGSRNNMIYSESDKPIALVGLDDIVVVDQPDALLVCKREEAQQVKAVVDELKVREDARLDTHSTEYRPWGSFTVIEEAGGHKIKKLCVLPGKKISLQLHHKRRENWSFVRGQGRMTLGDEAFDVTAGDSVVIEIEQQHRVANTGSEMLEIIEVQTGSYLGEDDIERIEDVYGRV